MRGSPWLEAVVAGALLLLVGLPIRALTSRTVRPAAAKPVGDAALPTPVRLGLVATVEAYEFEVKYLGRQIWSGTGHRTAVYTEVQLPLPKEGIDLEVIARFPDRELHALRLTVTTSDGTEVEHSAWANQTLDQVLTFQPAF